MKRHAKLILASAVLLCTVSACAMHKADRQAYNTPDMDMQKVLDAHASLKPKPIETLSAQEARRQPTPTDAVKKILVDEGKNPNDAMGVLTKDINISGAAGSVPARLYWPKDTKPNEVLPVIVYYHGGGWVIADLDVYDAAPRGLAKQVHALVISAHYRQAPEHKFPAAHDDAFAAYRWALRNAVTYHADAKRIAVVGESAGANLAINTAIKARNARIQMPLYQALVYPVAGTDMNTQSYQENANAKPLNKPMMDWFVKNVIRSEKDKADPRIDLVGHADLHGLPPTTLVTAQIDPLRTDGERLASKLEQSGVPLHYQNYEGVTHEFFGMAAVVGKAADAQVLVASDLKAALK